MLSVIVPCYNCADTIDRSVESILRQSLADLEIVLVEDGATDQTADKCDIWAAKDQRIRVIHQENRGLMGAWKRGVLQASGEYVAFVDSDDWIGRDYLLSLKSALKEKTDIVLGGFTLEYDTGQSYKCLNLCADGYYDADRIAQELLPNLFHRGGMESRAVLWSRCCKLYRREFLIRYFDDLDESISYGEDAVTLFVTLLHARGIVCTGSCEYHYCRNSSSMIGGYDTGALEKCLKLREAYLRLAEKYHYPYINQIEINYFENMLLNIKKTMSRGKIDLTSRTKQIKRMCDEKNMRQMLTKVDCRELQYGMKETVFVWLLRHHLYVGAIGISQILVRLRMSVE